MQATTPTGRRSTTAPMSPPGASGVAGTSDGGSGTDSCSTAPRA